LQAFAHRSSKGIGRFGSDSGHYTQLDQPKIVVDPIRAILLIPGGDVMKLVFTLAFFLRKRLFGVERGGVSDRQM
jgi:hypothetical protein